MAQDALKSRASTWWKFIFIIALVGVGTAGGYKLYEEGSKAGCFQLTEDLIPVEINPYRVDHLQLIAVGDTGTGNEDQFKVAEGMAKVCEEDGCDLVLMLGDNFYPYGVSSHLDPQFDSKFELVYTKINKPFFAVLGNHDVKQDVLSQVLYTLKSDTWRMPNYEYSFETSAARFYGLNTNCPFSSERLRKNLNQKEKEITADDSELPWTIVFGHHSVFSNGTHGDVDIFTRLYWSWLLEGRVDLYLSGHNHHLAHLQHGNSATDYLISGAGGKHYRSTSEREQLNKSAASVLYTHNDTGFIWLDISRGKLTIRFHDSSGKKIYEYTKKR